MRTSKTILKNTFWNWTAIFISFLVTMILAPYILEHLGKERYGIYRIVYSVVQYLTLMEVGVRAAVNRFASKHIYDRDVSSLNKLISTATFLCLLIGILALIITLILGVFAIDFFDISPSFQLQTRYLFVALGINMVLMFLGFSWGGVLVGNHRFDLFNGNIIIPAIVRALLIFVFFSCGWISLISFALALVLAQLTAVIFMVCASFYVEPALRIGLKYFSFDALKELWGFGLWNMLIQISGLLMISGNVVIIGKVLGPGAVPFYWLPYMIIRHLQQIVSGLSKTLVPWASSTLSSGNKKLLQILALNGTTVNSMIVFPIGCVLLVMCRSFFGVWVGEEYMSSWVVYAILAVGFLISTSQSSTRFILLGGGDIRGMAIVDAIGSLAAILLSIVLVTYTELGVVGAAIGLAVPQLFRRGLYLPITITKQLEMNLKTYLWQSYSKPVLCTIPSVILGYILVTFLPPSNLIFWLMEYTLALIPFGILALSGVMEWPLRREIIGRLRGLVFAGKIR